MKKQLCMLLAVLLMFTALPIVSFADSAATITLVQTDQSTNDFVEIKVNLANNPGIISADLNVMFSDNLRLVSAQNGSAFSKLTYIPPKALSNNLEMTSEAHFVWNGIDIQESDIADGTILTLGFRVIKGSPKAYQVSVTNDAVDRDMNPHVLSATKSIALSFSGWFASGGKWYFFENGVMVKSAWRKDSVGWVYLGSDGAMLTNAWCRDSVGWCYVGADGYAVTNCWKRDSVGWCYLDWNGSMTKNAWVLDGGKWYFCDSNGYMVSNTWRKDSKGWVYLGSDGAMLTNAWCRDSVGWCYVGADGYAVTNCWKRDSVGWCYLNWNGSMTKNAWVLDGGKWYFCDSNGYMLANTSYVWNGKRYYFNASGVCTNP